MARQKLMMLENYYFFLFEYSSITAWVHPCRQLRPQQHPLPLRRRHFRPRLQPPRRQQPAPYLQQGRQLPKRPVPRPALLHQHRLPGLRHQRPPHVTGVPAGQPPGPPRTCTLQPCPARPACSRRSRRLRPTDTLRAATRFHHPHPGTWTTHGGLRIQREARWHWRIL